MKAKNLVYVVDTHTEGEPTRIILGGFPNLKGSTLLEKRSFMAANFDWLRTAVLLEPRGHDNQFGALILPAIQDADYALIFMHAGGYLDVCGHATIGVTTAIIEMGMVEIREPYTTLNYETAAGIVTAKARVENGSVIEVSLVDVPSFYLGTYDVKIGESKSLTVDVSYGGNFYAIVDAKNLETRVRLSHINDLVTKGIAIRDAAAQQIPVHHPEFPNIPKKIELCMITDEPELPDRHGKNIVVFGKKQFDRSPCATGTAARLASMYSKGLIKSGELFKHESVINTLFKAKILETVRVGSYKGIVPEITGGAFITQMSNLTIDLRDPLYRGFRTIG